MREGWDNPNVFQICTLKYSSSDIRKRQEVGRGLRLCVNQAGERMDENFLGSSKAVHEINILTVIAGESYDDFTRKLQTEIADSVTYRPRKVTEKLFIGKILSDGRTIDESLARRITRNLIRQDYIDDNDDTLTDKYFDDKADGNLKFAAEVENCADTIIAILDSVYDERKLPIENNHKNNVKAEIPEGKLEMPEFKALWEKIHEKTFYEVTFDERELVSKAVDAINGRLNVPKIFLHIGRGSLESIQSKDDLIAGTAFEKISTDELLNSAIPADSSIKYDVVGRLVEVTGLTRQNIIEILSGVDEKIFAQFINNPEEFIAQVGKFINAVKAVTVIDHIQYHLTGDTYDTNIFTDTQLSGSLNVNAIPIKKSLYDHLIYDSDVEKNFAKAADASEKVVVYFKLPRGFFISTPFGKYTPDWAIAFREGEVKHIYFVAETKGSVESAQLRPIENFKIECAAKHFVTISKSQLTFKAVKNFDELMKLVANP